MRNSHKIMWKMAVKTVLYNYKICAVVAKRCTK